MIHLLTVMLDSNTTTLTWQDIAQTGGSIGLLSMAVLAFVKGWIVPGYQHKRAESDRDYFRDLALRGSDVAERQTKIAELLADRLIDSERDHRQDRLAAQADLFRREEREEARDRGRNER